MISLIKEMSVLGGGFWLLLNKTLHRNILNCLLLFFVVLLYSHYMNEALCKTMNSATAPTITELVLISLLWFSKLSVTTVRKIQGLRLTIVLQPFH